MSFFSRSKQFLRRHSRRMTHQFGLPVRLKGIKLNTTKIQSARILHHIFDGSYESAEEQSIKEIVGPKDRVLELGTGLGYVTCLAARRARHGSILSIEANPSMAIIARENLLLNRIQNAEVWNGVLGSQQGAMSFYISPHFWESSLTPQDGWIEKEVPVLSAVDVVSEFQPTVLIMDIEGGEYELLKNPFWSSHQGLRKISVEFHIRENAEQLLKQLSLNQVSWEWSVPLDDLARSLRKWNTTVTFSRIDSSE